MAPWIGEHIPPGVLANMERAAAEQLHVVTDADVSEQQAFERFFDSERQRLFRAMYLVTGSPEEAEELTQDAFLKVWERWGRVRAMDEPASYLYRTAFNASRSRYRRALRATKLPFLGSEDRDPFAASDLRDALVRATRELPRRQRAALVLTELLELSSEEAGRALGIKPATVRTLASQGRAALRTAMEKDDE